MLKYLPLVILIVSGKLWADLPKLSADDPIEFDANTRVLRASGNAELSHDDVHVVADEVALNQETLEATAAGCVQITAERSRLLSDCVSFNFDTNALGASNYRMGSPPYFVAGEEAEGELNAILLRGTTLYLGEPDFLTLNLLAGEVLIENARSGGPTQYTARNVVLRMGMVPFFYVPYLTHSSQELPITFENTNGFRRRTFGAYTRNTILFQGSKSLKYGGLIDYYQRRGVLFGPAYSYHKYDEHGSVQSDLRAGYMRDNGPRGVDVRKTPIDAHRHFLELQHKQQYEDSITLTGQVRYWSDSEVLRDFRPGVFNHDQDPDNFVEMAYRGDYYVLSGFSRFAPNNFQRVQERIPEVNFDLLPNRPFAGIPLYQRLNASYAYLQQRDKTSLATDTLRSHRFNAFYGLSLPVSLGSALTVTPVAGGRVTHYPDHNARSDNFTRILGQLGADIQLNMYGQWDVCSDIWKIDGLRHIIRPIVQYRYFPEATAGNQPIPLIEPDIFTTNMPPMDLGYLRDRDFSEERNRIRMGLENVLQTRCCDYGSRDLLEFNIYQDYLLETRAEECDWSDMFIEGVLKPAYWLNFSIYSRIDPNSWTLQEIRTRTTLTNARFWKVIFTTDSLHRSSNQYYLDALWNIDPRTTLYGHWRYDHKLESLTKQSYGMRTHVANNWEVDMRVTRRTNTTREQDWEFELSLILSPLGTKLPAIAF